MSGFLVPEVSFLSGQVTLLGKPELIIHGQSIDVRSQKGRALLFYLAANAGRTFTRHHLADLIWENRMDADGRNVLGTTLNRLASRLPIWPLKTGRSGVGWSLECPIAVDVVRFRALTGELAAANGCLNPEQVALMEQAAALWQGPFMAQFELPESESYEEWLRSERQVWELRMLEIISRLVEWHSAAGRWQEVIRHAQTGLAIDRLQEHLQRAVMTALARQGNRAAALAQCEEWRKYLWDELGTEPDQATASLRAAIEAGEVTESPTDLIDATGSASMLPVVGRQWELESMHILLQQGREGRGGVLLLTGEPGIGKTRLAEELMSRLRNGRSPQYQNWRLLYGRCYQNETGLPYAPFMDALRELCRPLQHASSPTLDVWLAELRRLLPELGSLRPDLPEPAAVPRGQEQYRLLEAVAQLISHTASPVLLVIDDLQWADDASLMLLSHLVRHPSAGNLVVLTTARASDLPPATERLADTLAREGRLRRERLQGLAPSEIHALVSLVLKADPHGFSDVIYAASKGNPLFAVELLRSVRHRQEHLPQTLEELVAQPLPETLEAALGERLATLGPQAAELLSGVAIMPEGAPWTLLEQMLTTPSNELLQALDSLIRLGIVAEDRESGMVSFTHDLVRSMIQNRQSAARTQMLHKRAFYALQEGSAAAGLTQALATHAVKGGLWEQGLDWSLRASEEAERVFAYPAAARHLEQALACLRHLPDTLEHRRQEIDIRLQLGNLGHFFEPGRLGGWVEPAVDAASVIGDDDRLNRAWMTLSEGLTIQGKLARAESILQRLLQLGRATNNRWLLAHSLMFLGGVHAIRGDHARAIALLKEAVQYTGHLSHGALVAGTYGSLAATYATVCQFEEAEAMAEQLLLHNRDKLDPALMGYALTTSAIIALNRGDWHQTLMESKRGEDYARKGKHHFYEYLASYPAGEALLRLGRLEEALAAQEHTLELNKKARSTIVLDRVWAIQGELLMRLGRIGEAEEAVAKARKLAHENDYLYGKAQSERVLGQIRRAQGRRDEADAVLRKAMEGFRAIGALHEVARCHALLNLTAMPEKNR